jgi:hypothetical protein
MLTTSASAAAIVRLNLLMAVPAPLGAQRVRPRVWSS